ncbi:hypothetical protein Tco_0222395 [Tanacetum coccineum]
MHLSVPPKLVFLFGRLLVLSRRAGDEHTFPTESWYPTKGYTHPVCNTSVRRHPGECRRSAGKNSEKSFEELKALLVSSPILTFHLGTRGGFPDLHDASKKGLGCVSSCSMGKVIAYASRQSLKYPMSELILLMTGVTTAIVFALENLETLS